MKYLLDKTLTFHNDHMFSGRLTCSQISLANCSLLDILILSYF